MLENVLLHQLLFLNNKSSSVCGTSLVIGFYQSGEACDSFHSGDSGNMDQGFWLQGHGEG